MCMYASSAERVAIVEADGMVRLDEWQAVEKKPASMYSAGGANRQGRPCSPDVRQRESRRREQGS